MGKSKRVFWQALIFTVVIFSIGIILGFFLDFSRADKVQLNLLNSEINLLDEQLREGIVGNFNVSCEASRESLFNFANNIYDEAVQLESYDSASKFGDTLFILHRRYDLLRTVLWMQAIELKKTCGDDFHTVVYLYEYNVDDVDVRSKQLFFSRLLLDVKNDMPEDVVLIPIAINMDLESVDLIRQSYDLPKEAAIIIDEKKVVSDIVTFDEFKNLVF